MIGQSSVSLCVGRILLANENIGYNVMVKCLFRYLNETSIMLLVKILIAIVGSDRLNHPEISMTVRSCPRNYRTAASASLIWILISIHPVPLAVHYAGYSINCWTFRILLGHFAKCPISHIAHNIYVYYFPSIIGCHSWIYQQANMQTA